MGQDMRLLAFVVVLFCVLGCGNSGVSGSDLEEEDGFRRLLRRASAEADRPLLREIRRNKDDEDEDSFEAPHENIVRKRREEEDHFYHTLLQRATQKRHEKRSFDTDDVDNKDALGMREDWTGDSKISDADKSELENLFSTLNRNDAVKKDVTRSVDEDNTVNHAASDYASWLLEQPNSKLSGALAHKLEIDHSLTKLLYEDKRDVNDEEEEEEEESSGGYKRNFLTRSNKKHAAGDRKNQVTNGNQTAASLVPSKDATAPVAPPQESVTEVKNNQTAPVVAAPAVPVTAVKQPEANMVDNTADSTGLTNQTISAVSQKANETSPIATTNKTVAVVAPEPIAVAAAPIAVAAAPVAVSPVANNNVNNNTVAETETSSSPSNETSYVIDTSPLVDAGKPVNETSPVTEAALPVLMTNCTTPECACQSTCEPKQVASVEPCSCQEQVTNASLQVPASTPQGVKGITIPNQGAKLCTDDTPQCLCQRACYPKLTATLNPCSCQGDDKKNMTAAPVAQVAPVAPVSGAVANATNAAPQPINNWCQSACQPYGGVSTNSPCACVNQAATATAKSFPPRAPYVVGAPQAAQAVNGYPANYAGAAAQYPGAYPASYQYPLVPSVGKTSDSNPEVRTSVSSQEGVCERSCFPHTMLRQKPCLCSNQTGATVKKEKAATPLMKRIDQSSTYYQGCFKDMRPLRDLPKRFTRYATTPETCVRECAYQNYKFAGVQYGYLCFCGNAFGRYGSLPDNDCNSECQGDLKRRCGGYYHNSVFSVDGKEYDPSDFDFAKVDDEEKKRDALLAAQDGNLQQQQQQLQQSYYDLTPAGYPPLTPLANNYPGQPMVGVDSIHQSTQGANVATHLVKAAQAALTAAQKLLPSVSKKNKISSKGNKVKREDNEEDAQIMEDKMSVMASLGAVHDILRKTSFAPEKRDADREKRSVSEDSDPYDPEDGKDLLAAYMANVAQYRRETRSVDEEEEEDEDEKPHFEYRRMILGDNDDGLFVEKYQKRQHQADKKQEPMAKKRDLLDFVPYKHINTMPGKRDAEKVKRAVASNEGSAFVPLVKKNKLQKRSPAKEASGANLRKRRSMEGSGANLRKWRSMEGSGTNLRKRRSMEGSGANLRKQRSVEGSGANLRKRRSMEGSGANLRKRRSVEGSGANLRKRRSIESSGMSPSLKKRALAEGSGAQMKKREVSMADLPDGAVKMAARSGDVNDIEASLKALEYLAKRDVVPKEETSNNEESDEDNGENESGDSEDSEEDGSGSGDFEDQDPEIDRLFEKRSLTEEYSTQESPKLRSDVDKGVDNLLNLVVELYKQQKTIRAFESSVRSLRDDIMRELNVPKYKKQYASKKVRQQIERTAKNRLHVLTSSIEKKIKEFAKVHPEASKQASLASTLLPQLPLSDAKYKIAKREISRRSAEFDVLEDVAFVKRPEGDNGISDILKEHFRHNSESDEGERPKRHLEDRKVSAEEEKKDAFEALFH